MIQYLKTRLDDIARNVELTRTALDAHTATQVPTERLVHPAAMLDELASNLGTVLEDIEKAVDS